MVLWLQIITLLAGATGGLVATFGKTTEGARKGLGALTRLGWIALCMVLLGASATGTLLLVQNARRESDTMRRNLRRQMSCIPLFRGIRDHITDLWLTAKQVGLDAPMPSTMTDSEYLKFLMDSGFVQASGHFCPNKIVFPRGGSANEHLWASSQAILAAIHNILTNRVDDFEPEEMAVFVEVEYTLSIEVFPYDNAAFYAPIPDNINKERAALLVELRVFSFRNRIALLGKALAIAERSFAMHSPLVKDPTRYPFLIYGRLAYERWKALAPDQQEPPTTQQKLQPSACAP